MTFRKFKFILPLFALVVLFFSSCSDKNGENLPPATGNSGDMYLVMDSMQWKGPLGRELDSLFNQEMEGLPRQEPIFRMRWIDARKLNSVLKRNRNIVYAVTLDQRGDGANRIKKMFTKESVAQIKSNPDFFSQNAPNVFAKGQEVMYLFSTTEQGLINQIKKHGDKVVAYMNLKERERLTTTLFKSKQVKGVTDMLRKDFQCEMKIPFGYQFVMKEADFLWVRQINSRDDKDIFIARKKYRSQEQFQKDSLIAFRDDVCRKYLFSDPDRNDTYLVTETGIPYKPVTTEEVNFNNKFAVKMTGLWRTNNLTMGGPFLSFTLVDEPAGQLYYIEGFTISPGKPQREIMRELETILYTFRTSAEIQKPAQ